MVGDHRVFTAGVMLLVAFVVVEARVTSTLLPLRILTERNRPARASWWASR